MKKAKRFYHCIPTPSWMPSTTRMCCRSVWITSKRWTQSRTWTTSRFGTLTGKRRLWQRWPLPSVVRWRKSSKSSASAVLIRFSAWLLCRWQSCTIRSSKSRWRQTRPRGCALPPFTAMEPTKPKLTGFWTRKTRKIPPILTRAAGIFWMPLFRTTTRCSIRTTPLMANGSRITTKMYRSA